MGRLTILGFGRGENFHQLLRDERLLSSDFIVIPRPLPDKVRREIEKSGVKMHFPDYSADFSSAPEAAAAIAAASLEQWREMLLERVARLVQENERTVCLLPGRPWPGEGFYQLLTKKARQEKWHFEVIPGEDLCSPLLEYLQEGAPDFSPARGVTWIDALFLDELREPPRGELLIAHADSIFILEQAKEILKPFYPADHPVDVLEFIPPEDILRHPHPSRHPMDILKSAPQGVIYRLARVRLGELDKVSALGAPHGLTFLRLPPRQSYYLGDMAYLMKRLRAPDGCPWDREQDHKTLRPFLLEETYEVLEAINSGEPAHLCEELGDLLLQIIFHSQLAMEKDEFYLWQVIDGISRKIYRRHPHVFQNEKAKNAREVNLIWQQIKAQEKKEQGKEGQEKEGQGEKKKDRFVLPAGLPALLRAQKILKRAAELGFDWPDMSGVAAKIFEELEEFRESLEGGCKEEIADELGDLFFTLVNAARYLGLDAESILHGTSEKFIRRFRYVDEQVSLRGGDYKEFSLQELDGWWKEAKKREVKGTLP